ncbi:unnamed protein product [Orchesella dallaii]|uniref:EF-hand domain-containing protein n=2 Tax=Orchesella dallaii TaxID=48710 RepID=A0ABP1QII3_9HEXA
MGEELAEEQLLDFCRRHGLAKDGYLDETELTTVCKCIGLQVSSEMIKELFEELDGDKDGRVCLSELSQMLRGMQDKIPPSPEKHKLGNDTGNSRQVGKGNGFTNIPANERGAFSILDRENTGFAKVGLILDLWSQLGIVETEGSKLLSELGFTPNSKSHSINLQDLAKSVEDEIDHSKERIPLAFQVALLTYRTESQFLKTLCESIECERDKLKADILDAHQRSALIAQEVDEQNSRLERNSQMLLRKMEIKYNEQIQDIQNRFSSEKESLQQALHLAETKLKELQDEDSKLKTQINKLNEENSNLEKEVHNVSIEIRNVNRMRSHLEREVSRFIGLENQLQEIERKYTDSLANSDTKLKDTYNEMQTLRDQNDELSMQLESVRETLKIVQATQSKEKRFVQKKRKGSLSSLNQSHSALNNTSFRLITNQDGDESTRMEEGDMPLHKIGKYYSTHEDKSLEDTEECDSSLEQIIPIPMSNNSAEIQCSSGTGTCPTAPIAIRLAACVGESSTDPINNGDIGGEEEMESEPSLSAIEERLLMGQSEKDCASLESEMCAVVNSEILSEENSKGEGTNFDGAIKIVKTMEDKEIQFGSAELKDSTTQTGDENGSSDLGFNSGSESSHLELIEQLKLKISQLEQEISEKKAAFEKEKGDLTANNNELENSLELLKEEYERCEDYWHEKLQEARELYEQDKTDMDEKFHDLLQKIKEYEELVMHPMVNERLPPIEERASLERQVTDLEEECLVLRKELTSVRIDQESAINTYQRSFENKLKDECANLEQQVSALSKKCQDYESRLSTLAEEERSTVEENGMVDMMKERIKHLDLQLKSQEEKFRQQVTQLEATLKEREVLYKKSIPDISKPMSPHFSHNNWNNNELITQSKSKSLLEMLQNSQQRESIWPQRFANVGDKSSSLPFIPAADPTMAIQPGAWGSLSPPFQQDASWAVPPGAPMKKAWCHVELGWLQSLRARLKQREEQCYLLQRALQQKDSQTEKILTGQTVT